MRRRSANDLRATARRDSGALIHIFAQRDAKLQASISVLDALEVMVGVFQAWRSMWE